MKRDLATIEIALGHAIKLEAYEQLLAASAVVSSDPERGRVRHRPQTVFAVTAKQDDNTEDKTALRKCVEQLEEALKLATKGVLALAAGGEHAAPQNAAATAGAARGTATKKSASKGGAGAHGASGRGKSGRGDTSAPRRDPKTDPCHICKQLGHW